jgi:hypothetical protein
VLLCAHRKNAQDKLEALLQKEYDLSLEQAAAIKEVRRRAQRADGEGDDPTDDLEAQIPLLQVGIQRSFQTPGPHARQLRRFERSVSPV